MAPPRGQYQTKLNAVMYAMMLEELLSGPCTAQHLADHTGMAVLTVQRTMRPMYARGLVHIAAWEKDSTGRHVIRVFGFGAGRDAKRPTPKTRTERARATRARRTMAQLHQMAASPAFQ